MKSNRHESTDQVDAHLELHLALAVYLTTYTGINEATKEFMNSLEDGNRLTFEIYLKDWVDDFKSNLDDDFFLQVKTNLDFYQATMKRIVNGDTRLSAKMLTIRKFFSVPWLICPDTLIKNLR